MAPRYIKLFRINIKAWKWVHYTPFIIRIEDS